MARPISSLFVEIAANTATLQRDLGKATRILDREAAKWDKRIKTFSTALGAAFGGLSAAALTKGIRSVMEFSDTLVNTANRVGQSTEAIQALRQEAEKIGLSIEGTDNALQRFSRLVGEARNSMLQTGKAGGTLGKVFEQYNISLRDAAGRQKDLATLLEEFKALLSSTADPAERNRLAMAGFGKEGIKLGQVLTGLDGTINQTSESLLKQGRIMKDESVQAAATLQTKYTEAMQKVNTLWQKFVISVLDGWTKIGRAFKEGMPFLTSNLGETNAPFTALNNDLTRVNAQLVNQKETVDKLKAAYDALVAGGAAADTIAKAESRLARETATLNQLRGQQTRIEESLAATRKKSAEAAAAQVAAEKRTAAATASSSKLTGLKPEFATNLQAMIEAASKEGISIGITSGLRSTERQAQLWAEALKKYGSAAAARKWVAPPGSSMHEKGIAADVKTTAAGWEWLNKNLEKFGLWRPLNNERWHIELEGSRGAAKGVKDYSDAMRAAADKEKETQRIMDEAAAIRARVNEQIAQSRVSYDSLLASLDPVVAATQEHARAVQIVSEALQYQTISQEQATAAIELSRERMDEALAGIEESAMSLQDSVLATVQQGIGGMIQSLIDGTERASDALKNLAKQIAAMAIQYALFGGGSGGGILGKFFATGGYGQLALPHGVYSRPTAFPIPGSGVRRFAKGVGILGEAGPEAILPLTRTSGGKLGVQGTGGTVVNVKVENNTPANVQVRETPRSDGGKDITILINEAVRKEMARGGYDSQMRRNYGLPRRGF